MKKLVDICINVILPLGLGFIFYFLPVGQFVRNYLPDGLWAYSLTSMILIIWNRRINSSWIIILIGFFLIFESLQYLQLVNGTGDIVDILFYLFFFFIALITNTIIINMKNQKRNLLALATLCIFIIIAIASTNNTSSTDSSLASTDSSDTSEPSNSIASKYILGLTPPDVYLNMEKQGFKTEKQFNSEYGNLWTSTSKIEGIEYRVETFSSDVNNVENVRATAMVDATQKNIIAAQQFLKFVSSLPYESAEPQKAIKWVEDNYNNDKASVIIGDVRFILGAPSSAVRMLTLEKANLILN
ncbi:MAG TPA: hypothetical protein VK469_13870 [Candidatus Kapabacteria bacterium]|nr:hypothetical protein [Candidatus Kapabacteria bacterium]